MFAVDIYRIDFFHFFTLSLLKFPLLHTLEGDKDMNSDQLAQSLSFLINHWADAKIKEIKRKYMLF